MRRTHRESEGVYSEQPSNSCAAPAKAWTATTSGATAQGHRDTVGPPDDAQLKPKDLSMSSHGPPTVLDFGQ